MKEANISKQDRFKLLLSILLLSIAILIAPQVLGQQNEQRFPSVEKPNIEALRAAIRDLTESFGEKYPKGPEYLKQLNAIAPTVRRGDQVALQKFNRLKEEALLANPLLEFGRLLCIKRQVKHSLDFKTLGFPSNHECNSSLNRTGYNNEIAILTPIQSGGQWKTLYRPKHSGYVGEVDLHWEGDRLLFTQSDKENWKVYEIGVDGGGLWQVSRMPKDVDSFDACYLPNGKIVFGSTASFQSVPCWHGQKWVSNLYLMNADGSGVRQICFDQDHDFHPSVLPNGQILYHRWDYTGINHIFMRQLMVMNPDGTGQRAIYGSNSWFPNSLYFPRALPGRNEQLISVLSGYHGVHRMGQLVLIDIAQGWYEADGLVKRISGKGDPITPKIRDNLVDEDWPKFLTPFPLSEKYFLVSACMHPQDSWGIYLADVFDNLVLIHKMPGHALLEPVPLRKQPQPPIIPDRVDLKRDDALVYLHDVYSGPGLKNVPRGTITHLRILAYHFGYRHLAGPDKVGYGGPWEVMRILGTVPVEKDGSTFFRVPANTPLAVQTLDAEGKAVQLMRSWFTAMPGEKVSCVGCHESPGESVPSQLVRAAQMQPHEIEPWFGPARGFDFAREVQPVLDRHCVTCHDGDHPGRPDLRPEHLVKNYRGKKLSGLGVSRLHPKMKKETQGILKYTPAYEALMPYIRRVNVEDDVSLLTPGEYHADTNELIQMLKKGHQGVQLEAESMNRLVTWIDLNGPCHGTWGEVHSYPTDSCERRKEMFKQYGGPTDNPEQIPQISKINLKPSHAKSAPRLEFVRADGWPFDRQAAQKKQSSDGLWQNVLPLAKGIQLNLVRIPAGEFVMGDMKGYPDELPQTRVVIDKPFWMGICEVSNEQFRLFDPAHDCRYYQKRHARADDRGRLLNEPQQPVVRVSWREAMAFCDWLSHQTGMKFTLPTEAQWEYACRAGSDKALFYGNVKADFSMWANVGDKSFTQGNKGEFQQVTGGLEHLMMEGADLADNRFDDKAIVTAPVGSYQPNAWGLYDMHGNAAEWTRSMYQAYPYRADDGRNDISHSGRKVVRGGSFFDRPLRCRSAVRYDYPDWQRVFNVGFRVVCEIDPARGKVTQRSNERF